MGLKCAGSTFQLFMDEVLRSLPNCFAYIDDIFIFSENREEHLKHLAAVFNRFNHLA